MEDRLCVLEEKLVEINDKLDKLLQLCETDIQPNCHKMGTHITFVESIYENIKNPLGYICHLVSSVQRGESEPYSLTDIPDYS